MRKSLCYRRPGSALLLTIFVFALFSILGALLIKIVYNNSASANALLQRSQAFYLAEAGLEKGKVELAHNPNWYTDLPYYLKDNVEWLINYAAGQETNLGGGRFKVIRERGSDALFSVGFMGRGVVVLKLRFSALPFKKLKWLEL